MKSYSAKIAKIGINPYMHVPEDVLNSLFERAGINKGPIPVRGTINGEMRQAAGVDVGDQAYIKIEFDPVPRIEAIHPKFAQALLKYKVAKAAFEKIKPSRQKEMLRYLNSMKTETSLERNVEKIMHHLLCEQTSG